MSGIYAKLEDMVTGAGRNDFDLLSGQLHRFCPFEAIGMARQEIRHSRFLAYILDPARPHGFGDTLLRELVALLAQRAQQSRLRRLDLLFRPLNGATLRTEWNGIDILAQIPPTPDDQGIIVALELKVDALESENQLETYSRRLCERYPPDAWVHLYGFVTKCGVDPTTHNGFDWPALSYTDLLTAFAGRIDALDGSPEAEPLFREYLTMMKREGIMKGTMNARIDEAVSRLWLHHREALEYLMKHRPDPASHVLAVLEDEAEAIMKAITKNNEPRLDKGPNAPNFRRFRLVGLEETYPALLNGTVDWMNTKSSVWVEITAPNDDSVKVSIVVGAMDESPEFRNDLISALRNEFTQRGTSSNTYAHFGKEDLLQNMVLRQVIASHGDPVTVLSNALSDYLSRQIPKIIAALDATGRS